MKRTDFDKVDIKADGNCFFRAISYVIYGTEDRHEHLRERTVFHIVRNWAEFKDFIIGDLSYSLSIRTPVDYYNTMIRSGEHGGIQEALAISELYDVKVNIFDNESPDSPPIQVGESSMSRNIALLFSGVRESGHFDALMPKFRAANSKLTAYGFLKHTGWIR